MRILIVEDEERLADALRRGLEAEGFEVDVTHDGSDGLWRAREGSYAAIVLDILLPGTNGYEVCRTLRADGVWTPILMLTAKQGELDEVEAFELGADDFLTKPFSFPVLVARLRSLARRGSGPRPDRLHVDDLVLDPRGRTCARGTVGIDLTPREFAVLEALMRRPGEVLTKAELLDGVWGLDFAGDPNVVEVYIGYLRRKVDRPFDQASIQTVRGVGYRIAPSAALHA
ncbi:MAG: response regulator transcription factor [Acidimicrobiales bacterium]